MSVDFTVTVPSRPVAVTPALFCNGEGLVVVMVTVEIKVIELESVVVIVVSGIC